MLDWDPSHDWVLYRSRRDLTRVTVQFRDTSPSVIELAGLRRYVSHLRDTPPAALRDAVGIYGMLTLGTLPTPDARRLIDAAEAQGLKVVAERFSVVGYLPIDRTTGCA